MKKKSEEKTFARSGHPEVPEGTPEEIRTQIGWEVRKPVPTADSDLGIAVTLPEIQDRPRHRLVVLGDSIAHGFKSFAIADTHLSWPALVARYAGFADFRYPRYPGPDRCPGLPLNLEALARKLEEDAPRSVLDIGSDALLLGQLRNLMDEVEDYWERDKGARLVEESAGGEVNHNLAIWGWDIRDALSRNVGGLREQVRTAPGRRDQAFKQITSAAGERSALITLAGGNEEDTPVSLARRLGDEGQGEEPGIETLVVALGPNNVLGTVINFELNWTDPRSDDFKDLDEKRKYNAWLPSHFSVEYDVLLAEVRRIKARHVIFLTVPHVTIAPMMRGIGHKMPGDRYFARYTRAWIPDHAFSANRDPCLTGNHLRALDFAVDKYNDHIVKRVREARDDKDNPRDWRVVDIAGVLDRLAYRRFLVDEQAQPDWWTPYDLPNAYQELSPQPDTRFYRSDRFGRFEGGLVALDGVHPSTIGYGIIAGEVMGVMGDCGVQMEQAQPNFHGIVQDDSLVTDPPTRIASWLELVGHVNRNWNLYRAMTDRSPV